MKKKLWSRWLPLVLLVLMGAGCAGIGNQDPAAAARGRMDAYAAQRYDNALRYLETGRYELAMDQFAAAAAAATDPELKRLAEDGYARAGRTIAARR